MPSGGASSAARPVGLAAILAGAVAASVTATATAARPSLLGAPVGAVADCSTRSMASFPAAFTRRSNLVVGPLAMIGAGGTALFVPAAGGNKFPLLVKAGHRVTIELSAATRATAGLAYGPLPQGEVRLRDAHRVVTFIACLRDEPSGSSADGQPVTFWAGGILATSPRCVPLQIWIDGASHPRQVVVHLGRHGCR
jgi:hypothetical protein